MDKRISESSRVPLVFYTSECLKKLGGIQFLLQCNYDASKLPQKLSKFHQQSLTAAKLSFVHNFSPHRTIIWNNEYITRKNKSLYLQNWIDRNIIYLADLQNDDGNILKYEEFLKCKTFPVTNKEYQSVITAIPNGILQLMKCHFEKPQIQKKDFSFFVNGIDIKDKHCTNKHIRNHFYSKRKITPRGKLLWNSHFSDIQWKTAWLLPYKFAISNKIRDVPTNQLISRFVDIDKMCVFCKRKEETIIHLFYECEQSLSFWKNFEEFFEVQCKNVIKLEAKDILLYYSNKNVKIQQLVNLMILVAKFHIHKAKFSKSCPSLVSFKVEFNLYCESIQLISNKKCDSTVSLIKELFTDI